jgi:hypothetical protein
MYDVASTRCATIKAKGSKIRMPSFLLVSCHHSHPQIDNVMPGKYDDSDWDELPAEIQAAAGLLGYTKDIWDSDGTPEEIEDSDWADLSPAQQDAATLLGYAEQSWDESD